MALGYILHTLLYKWEKKHPKSTLQKKQKKPPENSIQHLWP